MKLDITKPCLHSQLEIDGHVTYGIYLSNECPDDGFEEAMEEWLYGTSPVYINYRFSIRECIEDSINNYKLPGIAGSVIEENNRPVFDSLRTELLEMIDGLWVILSEELKYLLHRFVRD